MRFRNGKHRLAFEAAISKLDRKNNALVSAVYLLTADRANEDGDCWPAIPTISRELKLSQSTVRRALYDLRKEGLIQTEQRYRKNGAKSSLLYSIKRG